MIGPGGQHDKWYFWRVSFAGDDIPTKVLDNVISHDPISMIVWALNPRKAIQNAKEKCYGYGGGVFWDKHYEDNKIDVEPSDSPFNDPVYQMPTADKVNVSELKLKVNAPVPEEPKPVAEPEPEKSVQLSFLDSTIEQAIDSLVGV